MKRILTVAFCLLAIVAGLLYHTLHLGGTPFSPATLPQSYILTVLPLDSRPPCTSFVRQLGNLAGFAVELPPDELLDKYENAALVTELRKWLVTKITGSNGILISTDMLSYGGLLHNRIAPLTQEQKLQTLQFLGKLRDENPGKDFYAYSIIPRLLVSDQILPDRWYQWHIMQWTINMDKKMQGLPFDEKRYKQMQDEIPAKLKEKYLNLYAQNAAFNQELIDLAVDKKFTGLLIGQDDTMMFGLPNGNRWAAEDTLHKLNVPPSYGVTQGADEIGAIDTAALFLMKHNFRPKIYLTYSTPQTKDLFLHFVPDSLENIALDKIKLLNGQVVSSVEDADFILFIHCGDNPGASYRDIAQNVRQLMTQKPVALVDLSEDYDYRECLFPSLLVNNTPVPQLLSYAGWNSASNSIGTALAQGAIVVLQSRLLSPAALPSLYARNLTFNCARFLDDWAYQQKIRYKIKDFQELNGIDTQHTAPYTSLVENYIARELAVYKNILLYTSLRRFPFYQFGKTAYYLKDLDYHVKLPWERVFEISLTVQPTFVKKTI